MGPKLSETGEMESSSVPIKQEAYTNEDLSIIVTIVVNSVRESRKDSTYGLLGLPTDIQVKHSMNRVVGPYLKLGDMALNSPRAGEIREAIMKRAAEQLNGSSE